MRDALLVGMGGAAGAILRFVLSGIFQRAQGFPFGTLGVNVLGCFLMGLLTAVVAAGTPARLLLGTGVLGGFTTFSAFGSETLELVRAGGERAAAVNVIANVVLGLGAVGLGRAIGLAYRIP